MACNSQRGGQNRDEIGCQVITVTNDIIKKLSLVGKDMDEYSLETVKMFYEDGKAAGYKL